MGSISAITIEFILYSDILSKLSWLIIDPDSKKDSSEIGFFNLFFTYLSIKKSFFTKIFF